MLNVSDMKTQGVIFVITKRAVSLINPWDDRAVPVIPVAVQRGLQLDHVGPQASFGGLRRSGTCLLRGMGFRWIQFKIFYIEL